MKARINKHGKKYIIASIILVVVQMGILFAAAGNLSITRAWLFTAVNLIYSVLAIVILHKLNPDLLNQRGTKHDNALNRDVILVKINNINMILLLPLVVGLDLRFDFLPLNEMWQVIGYTLYIMSNILVLGSMIANNHFEAHVRIQSDREHTVIKSWPYSFVRHPGYLGVILWLFAFPLIIGSILGIAFSLVISIGFIYRTVLEDSYLSTNLDGYKDYQNQVKGMLFPLSCKFSSPSNFKSACFITFILIGSIKINAQEIIKFDSDRWNVINGDVTQIQGEVAFSGTAILKDFEFFNGTIEWDLFTTGQRSYPGIFFRLNENQDYEHFYVRPHKTNGLNNDALQYTPAYRNISSWQLFHGEGYTKEVIAPSNTWVHYKIVVKDEQAKVFIDDMVNEVFTIHKLELGKTKGAVAINSPTDGSAYFANFSISSSVNEHFGERLTKPAISGAIFKWEISQSFNNSSFDHFEYPSSQINNTLEWKKIDADDSGLINLSKNVSRKPGQPTWLYAKTIINSEQEQSKWFSFGYSDYITVFLNGKAIFNGINAFTSRDPSYQGLIGYFDKINLNLNEGENELLLIVGEQFGGWGFMFRENGFEKLDQRISKKWSLNNCLSYPESVVWDEKNNVLYVSNFIGNQGEFISKVSVDGELIEKEWVKDIYRPTALLILRDSLYIVERKSIAIVDISSGTLAKRVPVQGAMFLNDIVATPDGKKLFVSDSEAGKIYVLENNVPKVFSNSELLVRPNAMAIMEDQLIIGCMGKNNLVSIKLQTNKVSPYCTVFPEMVIDGLQPLSDDALLFASFNGILYEKRGNSPALELINTLGNSVNFSDFIYIKSKRLLVVPGLYSNTLCAYSVNF